MYMGTIAVYFSYIILLYIVLKHNRVYIIL